MRLTVIIPFYNESERVAADPDIRNGLVVLARRNVSLFRHPPEPGP